MKRLLSLSLLLLTVHTALPGWKRLASVASASRQLFTKAAAANAGKASKRLGIQFFEKAKSVATPKRVALASALGATVYGALSCEVSCKDINSYIEECIKNKQFPKDVPVEVVVDYLLIDYKYLFFHIAANFMEACSEEYRVKFAAAMCDKIASIEANDINFYGAESFMEACPDEYRVKFAAAMCDKMASLEAKDINFYGASRFMEACSEEYRVKFAAAMCDKIASIEAKDINFSYAESFMEACPDEYRAKFAAAMCDKMASLEAKDINFYGASRFMEACPEEYRAKFAAAMCDKMASLEAKDINFYGASRFMEACPEEYRAKFVAVMCDKMASIEAKDINFSYALSFMEACPDEYRAKFVAAMCDKMASIEAKDIAFGKALSFMKACPDEYRAKFVAVMCDKMASLEAKDVNFYDAESFMKACPEEYRVKFAAAVYGKLDIVAEGVSGKHLMQNSDSFATALKGMPINKQAQEFERLERERGRTVLWHGDNARQQLARDFYKELYQQVNGVQLPEDFMFLRFGNVKEKLKQQSLDLEQQIKEIKGNPAQRPQMFYATLSLFASAGGSSPLDYFSSNSDQTSLSREMPTIKTICADNGISEIAFTDKVKELESLFDGAHKAGVLVAYSIADKYLDKAFYACKSGGEKDKIKLCGWWYWNSDQTSKIMRGMLQGCDKVKYEKHCGIIPVLERPEIAKCYVLADRNEETYIQYQQMLKNLVAEVVAEQHKQN